MRPYHFHFLVFILPREKLQHISHKFFKYEVSELKYIDLNALMWEYLQIHIGCLGDWRLLDKISQTKFRRFRTTVQESILQVSHNNSTYSRGSQATVTQISFLNLHCNYRLSSSKQRYQDHLLEFLFFFIRNVFPSEGRFFKLKMEKSVKWF